MKFSALIALAIATAVTAAPVNVSVSPYSDTLCKILTSSFCLHPFPNLSASQIEERQGSGGSGTQGGGLLGLGAGAVSEATLAPTPEEPEPVPQVPVASPTTVAVSSLPSSDARSVDLVHRERVSSVSVQGLVLEVTLAATLVVLVLVLPRPEVPPTMVVASSHPSSDDRSVALVLRVVVCWALLGVPASEEISLATPVVRALVSLDPAVSPTTAVVPSPLSPKCFCLKALLLPNALFLPSPRMNIETRLRATISYLLHGVSLL